MPPEISQDRVDPRGVLETTVQLEVKFRGYAERECAGEQRTEEATRTRQPFEGSGLLVVAPEDADPHHGMGGIGGDGDTGDGDEADPRVLELRGERVRDGVLYQRGDPLRSMLPGTGHRKCVAESMMRANPSLATSWSAAARTDSAWTRSPDTAQQLSSARCHRS